MGEHLVCDDRGVVDHEDPLNGHGGDLGDEDAAEGVGQCRVDADHVELDCVVGEADDVDFEVFGEGTHTEAVVDAHRGVGAGVLDAFCMDGGIGVADDAGALGLEVRGELAHGDVRHVEDGVED